MTSLLVAALCAEGGLLLVGLPTPSMLLPARTIRASFDATPLLTDAARLAAMPGGAIYADHPDPLVRYVLKPESTIRILDGTANTNSLGLRRRPGPAATADALHVVVLGDSVAFGYGVEDDQTLAARLEHYLALARGAGARQIVCHTVAVPSWNHRAAVAALLDHWDAYRPELVIYLPIHNDLSDATSVLSTGQLRLEPDPASHDPWLIVSRSRLAMLEASYSAALRLQARSPHHISDLFGPCAIEADLSPESSRRYAQNVASIRELERFLRDRSARLLLVHSAPSSYAWHLLSRLDTGPPAIPFLLLEGRSAPQHTLVDDSHPSATTLDVRALWLTADLLDRGWVDAVQRHALPAAPADYEALRLRPINAQEIRRQSQQSRAHDRATLHHEVDLRTGRGLRQVYGGLNPDASAGMRLLLLLDAAGPRLELTLASLPARSDIYPILVAVAVDDQPLAQLSLAPDSVIVETLDLPASIPIGKPIEVSFTPSRWCVVDNQGRAQISSFQLVRVACPPSER
jgi:hypothetical protein